MTARRLLTAATLAALSVLLRLYPRRFRDAFAALVVRDVRADLDRTEASSACCGSRGWRSPTAPADSPVNTSQRSSGGGTPREEDS